MVRYNYAYQVHGDDWKGFPPALSMQIFNAQTRGASVFQATLPQTKNGADSQVEFRFDEAATSPTCPQVPSTGIIMVGMRSGTTHVVKRELAKNTNAEKVAGTLRRMSTRYRRRASNAEEMPSRLPAPKYAPVSNASKTFASRKSISTWRKMSSAPKEGTDGSLSWGLYLSHAKKKLAKVEAETADSGRSGRRDDGFRKPKVNGPGRKARARWPRAAAARSRARARAQQGRRASIARARVTLAPFSATGYQAAVHRDSREGLRHEAALRRDLGAQSPERDRARPGGEIRGDVSAGAARRVDRDFVLRARLTLSSD